MESKKTIENIFSDLEFEQSDEDWRETKPVCFHIPNEYKKRYDQLQDLSKRKFGKKIIELIELSIDQGFSRLENKEK